MQENTANLPKTALLLVDLVGHQASMALVHALGGRSIRFPNGKRTDCTAHYESIVKIAGQNAADTLAKHFGGSPAYIPRCTRALREERNRRLIEEYDEVIQQRSCRSAVTAIAEKYGFTERHVNRIVNGELTAKTPNKATKSATCRH